MKARRCSGERWIETDGRNLEPAQAPAGGQPAVAGDDVQIGVDEDRDVEAEGLDARGDLTDLFGAVLARVAGIGLQAIQRNMLDR
jgi:hypothetical protein